MMYCTPTLSLPEHDTELIAASLSAQIRALITATLSHYEQTEAAARKQCSYKFLYVIRLPCIHLLPEGVFSVSVTKWVIARSQLRENHLREWSHAVSPSSAHLTELWNLLSCDTVQPTLASIHTLTSVFASTEMASVIFLLLTIHSGLPKEMPPSCVYHTAHYGL